MSKLIGPSGEKVMALMRITPEATRSFCAVNGRKCGNFFETRGSVGCRQRVIGQHDPADRLGMASVVAGGFCTGAVVNGQPGIMSRKGFTPG
jgi:hypothetical protein